MAKAQAAEIAADIEKNGGPANLQDQEIVAIVAYIQRLGQDIKLANAPSATATSRPAAGVPQVAARRTP
jgi:cbb3-type cytochrome oxidase cytochrome c subunit